VIKEYRETVSDLSTTYTWYGTISVRGPEVGRVKGQPLLYASDETLHLGFRDTNYRTAFFSFNLGNVLPTFIQVFAGNSLVSGKYIHSV